MRGLRTAASRALPDTGPLHAAAERCHATPGPVSAEITRREDYLGVRLFACRAAPAVLTPEGRELLPEIQAAVAQLHRVTDLARSHPGV